MAAHPQRTYIPACQHTHLNGRQAGRRADRQTDRPGAVVVVVVVARSIQWNAILDTTSYSCFLLSFTVQCEIEEHDVATFALLSTVNKVRNYSISQRRNDEVPKCARVLGQSSMLMANYDSARPAASDF